MVTLTSGSNFLNYQDFILFESLFIHYLGGMEVVKISVIWVMRKSDLTIGNGFVGGMTCVVTHSVYTLSIN